MEGIENGQGFNNIEDKQLMIYISIGYVFAILSLFVFHKLFGVLGVIMGVIANRRYKKGNPLIIISIIFALVGIIINSLVINFFRTFFEVMTIIY